MKFHISRQYDCTVELFDWLNPDDYGIDQYKYQFEEMGILNCAIGIDATTGRLRLETESLLTAANPVVMNPLSKTGIPLGKQNLVWSVSAVIPQINAYGQIYSYRYNLTQKKQAND